MPNKSTALVKLLGEEAPRELTTYIMTTDSNSFYDSVIESIQHLKPGIYGDLTAERLRYTLQKKMITLDWSEIVESILTDFRMALIEGKELKNLREYRGSFKIIIYSIFEDYLSTAYARQDEAEIMARHTLLQLENMGKELYIQMLGETKAWASNVEITNLAELLNLNIIQFTKEEGLYWTELPGNFNPNRLCVPLLRDNNHFDFIAPQPISFLKRCNITDYVANSSVIQFTAQEFASNLVVHALINFNNAHIRKGDIQSGPRIIFECLEYYKERDPEITYHIFKYILTFDLRHLIDYSDLLLEICRDRQYSSDLLIATLDIFNRANIEKGDHLAGPQAAINCLELYKESEPIKTTDILKYTLTLNPGCLINYRYLLKSICSDLYAEDSTEFTYLSEKIESIYSMVPQKIYEKYAKRIDSQERENVSRYRYLGIEHTIKLLERLKLPAENNYLLIKTAILLELENKIVSSVEEYYRVVGALTHCEKFFTRLTTNNQQSLLTDIYRAIYELTVTNSDLLKEEYRPLTSRHVKELKEKIILLGGGRAEESLKNTYLLFSSLAAKENGVIAEAVYYLECVNLQEYSYKKLASHYLNLGRTYEALGFEIERFNVPELANEYFSQGMLHLKTAMHYDKKGRVTPSKTNKFRSYLEMSEKAGITMQRKRPGLLLYLLKNQIGYYLARNNIDELLKGSSSVISPRTILTVTVPEDNEYFTNEIKNLDQLRRFVRVIERNKDGFNIEIDTAEAIRFYHRSQIHQESAASAAATPTKSHVKKHCRVAGVDIYIDPEIIKRIISNCTIHLNNTGKLSLEIQKVWINRLRGISEEQITTSFDKILGKHTYEVKSTYSKIVISNISEENFHKLCEATKIISSPSESEIMSSPAPFSASHELACCSLIYQTPQLLYVDTEVLRTLRNSHFVQSESTKLYILETNIPESIGEGETGFTDDDIESCLNKIINNSDYKIEARLGKIIVSNLSEEDVRVLSIALTSVAKAPSMAFV